MDNIWNGEGSAGQPFREVNYTFGTDLTEGFVPSPVESSLPDPPVPQSRKKASHNKRSKNFSPTEDETLCSAYLNVSKDPIVGVNQSMPCYWDRITEFYTQNKKTANPRTSNSLQHRWSDIQKDTSRFCGFYATIERRNQSGKSEDDKVKDALQIYDGLVGSPYRFLHCWLILRHENKWNTYLDGLSTPNAEEAGKATEGSKEGTLPPRIIRPLGRDKAKKLRSTSASNSSACLEVLQKMHNDRQVYEQRVVEETNAAESANAARAERKLAIQEEQLRVQQRMLRLQEEQQENFVMTMDLDKVAPWVRDFYKSKQMELAMKRAQHDASTSGI